MRKQFRKKNEVLFQLSLLFVLLWVTSPLILAEQLPIKSYTTADGLARDSINRIVQDSHGFLWFATADGLSRFDGYKFTNYGIEQGLPHRSINDLLETRSGLYWIATGNGLCLFNPNGNPQPGAASSNDPAQKSEATGSSSVPMFAVYLPGESRNSRVINVLFEDHAGVVWCGTGEGLYKLVQADGTWKALPFDFGLTNGTTGAPLITSLAEGLDGSLWVGTNIGLYRLRFDGRVEMYTTQQGLPNEGVSTILRDRDGRLWVGTAQGLCLLVATPEPNQQIVARVFTTRDGLASIVIFSLFQSAGGKLWVGTSDGLNEMLPAATGPEKVFRSYTTAQGLSDASIQSLNEDQEENLWVGTESGGAMKITNHGFTAYLEADGIGHPRIASILEDQSGQLCVIGASTKLFINGFDGRQFNPTNVNLPKGINLSWGWYQNIFQDREGEWWVATENGLVRFPKVAKLLELAQARPQYIYTKKDGLAFDQIFRVFEDSRGDLWIGLLNNPAVTLSRWERATQTFHSYTHADDGLPIYPPTAFREDAAGNLWIGFYQGGVARYRDGHFTFYSKQDGAPEGFFNAITLDHANRIWFATSQGLCRVDEPGAEHPRFVILTTADGLSSTQVTSITEDKAGRLYIGSGRGLDQLDPATGHIRHFTAADGLPNNYVNVSFTDRQGALWFGTLRGLARFIPEVERPPTPPPIMLGGLRIAGLPYKLSELGVTEVPKLELNPDQNQLQIDFFSIGFGAGEMLRYQYMLEGTDREWSAPSDQRSVNYANLRPGSYRFLVRAVNAGGLASSTPASISFSILPPIWRRWWFVTLAALLVASIVFALDRYRVARLRELDSALSESKILTGELTHQRAELRKANRTLELEYKVTRVLAESETPAAAVPSILAAICESARWDIGELWEVGEEGEALRCLDVWHVPELRVPSFENSSRAQVFKRGAGLPGRVWASGEPVWITDISEDANFPRALVAFIEGLRSAFGFPILLGSEVVGVLEFFSRERREPDPEMLAMMAGIGSQLGQLLERQRAAEALRESEDRMRTLAETASDAIITIDEASTILFINPAVEKVFGYGAAELVGENLTVLMPEYLRHLHSAGLRRYAETGLKHTSWEAIELPGLHKSGHEIPLELSFGEWSRNGKRYFTGIARDITERKRAEEELRRTREERLSELERVRKRIATDLHDDIGSSLTQISILSEVARRQMGGDDGPQTKPLSMIAHASRELVDSMSDIVWAINPQKDHLSDLTQRMRRFASDVFTARSIEFRLNIPGAERDVQMGANMRREIFLIFKESINNMVRHSGCTKAEIDFQIEVDRLVLKLSDNGKGFDTTRESEGHGLMSMRERAKSLGGELAFVSQNGGGTIVKLSVPLGHAMPVDGVQDHYLNR